MAVTVEPSVAPVGVPVLVPGERCASQAVLMTYEGALFVVTDVGKHRIRIISGQTGVISTLVVRPTAVVSPTRGPWVASGLTSRTVRKMDAPVLTNTPERVEYLSERIEVLEQFFATHPSASSAGFTQTQFAAVRDELAGRRAELAKDTRHRATKASRS